MNRTTIIADLQNEFAYLGSEEGDWLVEDLADYFLSLLQWKDVADGLPEVTGMYLFKRKGEAGSEAELYWYDPDCLNAKKARIREDYDALFGPIPEYKEQR